MKLKPSKYNFRASAGPDKNLLFNGFTGALYEFTDAELQLLEPLLNSGCVGGEGETESLRRVLGNGGFLVDSGRDEASELFRRGVDESRACDILELEINPTWECNARCSYCFIAQRSGRMNLVTEGAIGTFLAKQIPRFSEVRLLWSGGEPLLCTDTVCALSRVARDLAASAGVPLTVTLLTNGLLLNQERIRRLESAGVSHCHITLDGLANTHDRFRGIEQGSSPWATTMSNMHRLLNETDAITLNLRINVDESNTREAAQLLDMLDRSKRERIRIDISPVQPPSTEFGVSPAPSRGLLREINLLARRAICAGFRVAQPKCRPNRSTYCSADNLHNFHIGPDGAVTKCHDPAIAEAHVGDLAPDGTLQFGNRYSVWHSIPANESRCWECRYLCVCGGGCRLLRLQGISSPDCHAWFADMEGAIVNAYLEATTGRD